MSYRPSFFSPRNRLEVANSRHGIGIGSSRPRHFAMASPSGPQWPHHVVSASSSLEFEPCASVNSSCSASCGSTSFASPSTSSQRIPSNFTAEEMRSCFPGMYTKSKHRSTPYSRSIPKSSSAGAKQVKNFTRNVVLLSCKDTSIPRGRARQSLYDTGRIVDMFEFKGGWSAAETMEALDTAFSKVLDPNSSTPRFQFMKACYGLLKVPNVMPGHMWTPDKVKALSSNGDVYLQALSLSGDDDAKSITEPSSIRKYDQAGCTEAENTSSSDEFSNTEEDPDVQVLHEMFPSIPKKRLQEVAENETINTAVDVLLESGTSSYSPSLSELINDFVSSNVTESKEMWISISRSNIWNAVLQFYKTAKVNPDKLKFKLNVEFEGEEGIDVGALKGTFFELALNEGDERLFEGNIDSRVPKKDAGIEMYVEFFGMLIVHSIINGGPSPRNICPAIFQYIITGGNMESTSEKLQLTDIPKNMASADVIRLIEKVDACTETGELNEILNEPIFMTIINSSRWPITKMITMECKMDLLNCLVSEELIHKRLHTIQALERGLQCLGFLNMCKKHLETSKLLFLYEPQALTSNTFISLVEAPKDSTSTAAEKMAIQHFYSYITKTEGNTGGPTLATLLNFITGQSSVPPRGFKRIQIRFSTNNLPYSDCCFHIIHLPILNSAEQFFNAMDTALLGAGSYYLKP